MNSAADPKPFAMPDPIAEPADQLEPYDWYRQRREHSPVRYDGTRNCWDVFTYRDAVRILTDEVAFSSETDREIDVPLEMMLTTDPPRHTALRDSVEEYFTPGAVASLEPEIRSRAETLLRESVPAEGGEFDLVDPFAYTLPILTIAELLGVPTEDRERFKQWSDTLITVPQMSEGDPSEEHREEMMETAGELTAYFGDLMDRRQRTPREDLLSNVLTSENDFEEAEMLGLAVLLLVAGNVTTTNFVANAVWCFANQGVSHRVRSDDDFLESALEEVLRFRSPVQRTVRRATESVEVRGRRIDEGEFVVVWLGSANRDGSVFADPDTFVPDREPNQHIAFGRGVHFCLGAPLARLETQVAMEVFYDRVSTVDVNERQLRPIASNFIYGVEELPIRVDPA